MPRKVYHFRPRYKKRNARRTIVRTTVSRSSGSRKSWSTRSNASTAGSVRTGTRQVMVTGDFNAAHPFPQRMFKPLKYCQNVILNVGASGVFGGVQTFAMNSLYDPDITGGGHQPYARDTLTQIYNRYKVHACVVKVTVSDPSQDGLCIGAFVRTPTGSSDTIAGLYPEALKEKNVGSVHFINNTGSQLVIMSQKYMMYQVMGVTKEQYKTDIDNTTSGSGSAPADVLSIQFAAADLRGGSSGSISCMFEFLFYTEFYDRVLLAQS